MRNMQVKGRLPAPRVLWRMAALSICVSVGLLLSGLVGCSTPVPTPTNTPTTAANTPTPEADSTPEGASTPEATREPLVPLDDDPVMGSADAPVTMIEYSAYLCPYCRTFALETLPRIQEQYIDTGKVRFMFRDFPVHGQSEVALALVAECAADQGKFWEMQEYLWEGYDEWSQSQDVMGTFQEKAEDLGMDTEEFTTCFEAGTDVDRIVEDYNIAIQDGIEATPSFLVNGTLVRGAMPFEEFQKVIDQALGESG